MSKWSDKKQVASVKNEALYKAMTSWESTGDVAVFIDLIEQQQQEVERLNAENNKLKDFIQENDVDRLEKASDVIGEAMLEFFRESFDSKK